MKLFFIIHKVRICVNGSGSLFNYFKFQFRHFAVNDINNQKININLTISTKDSFSSIITKQTSISENKYCYASNENFLWVVREKKMSLPSAIDLSKTLEITAENTFPKMHFNTIFDFLLRLYLIKEGFILIHAASVSKNNKGIVIPAWKSVGKTELALKLVKHGFSFMGDDKIWINQNNEILSYPRYVVIKESNANSFIEFVGRKYLIKSKIKSILLLKNNSSILKILYNKIVSTILKNKIYHFPIERLYPDSNTINYSKFNRIIYLEKNNNFGIQHISKNTLKDIMESINILEWNTYLYELVASHDFCFPNYDSWIKKLETLVHAENEILMSAINNCEIFTLKLSSNKDWTQILDSIKKKI